MGIQLWLNIAASNNAWSNGVSPEQLAAIAKAAPVVKVFDLSDESVIGVTGQYEIRADGCELWSLCTLERQPGGDGKFHAEAVLMRVAEGPVQLGMVALTTMARGLIHEWMTQRYPGKVGRL